MLLYIHLYIHAYVFSFVRTYIHACTHTYMHAYLHTYTHTHIHTYLHTYICMHACVHTYMSVVNFDGLAQASNFRIERRQVVFLCWMQDSKLGSLGHQFARRLNAHSQNDWGIEDQAKNLNSTARPDDQRAFSPLDPTAGWHSHLALAMYMFVVVNFHYLAQASDFRIERKQVVSFEPRGSLELNFQHWMPADKQTELSRIKLKPWTRQPVPMISKHSAHSTPLPVDIRTGSGDTHVCCC